MGIGRQGFKQGIPHNALPGVTKETYAEESGTVGKLQPTIYLMEVPKLPTFAAEGVVSIATAS